MTDQEDIRNYGFRLLAKREYSVANFREKLVKKFPDQEAVIEEVITDFCEKDFLSDQRFTELFVEDKINLKTWGPQKIYQGLYQKGVPEKLAKKIITEKFLPDIESQKALTIAREKYAEIRRLKKTDNSLQMKQKLSNFLRGKGFGFSIIQTTLDKL